MSVEYLQRAARKGSVLATRAVETEGKGGVVPDEWDQRDDAILSNLSTSHLFSRAKAAHLALSASSGTKEMSNPV